ncbi:MAG: hypothetical protein M1504_03480 [Candidatus Marsarchaeota archaeon]|nr:hypothetical protein [Candidatus Marsarchaeota archaeon]
MNNMILLAGIAVIAVVMAAGVVLLYNGVINTGIIKAPFVEPATPVAPDCPLPVLGTSTTFVNYTGFSYYVSNSTHLGDYLIGLGDNGTITYAISLTYVYTFNYTKHNITGRSITNKVWFSYILPNGTSVYEANSVPGINVTFSPASENLRLKYLGMKNTTEHASNGTYNVSTPIYNNTQVNVTARFSISANAMQGTYFMEFAPGICDGGKYLLLTIGTSPYDGNAIVRYPA